MLAIQRKEQLQKELEEKERILIEQERIRLEQLKIEEEKRKIPPVVTFETLTMNSMSWFYSSQKQEQNMEDSAINFVKNMIGIEEEQEDDLNNRSNNFDMSQELYLNINRNSIESPNEIANPRFIVTDKSNLNTITKNRLAITSHPYVGEKNEIKDNSNSEITTLEVIINPKTNKKLKAILPKAHLRNINVNQNSDEKWREVALYKPTKNSSNACSILIII